jgi:hypothetical protein
MVMRRNSFRDLTLLSRFPGGRGAFKTPFSARNALIFVDVV